ncbi:MAG TPA: nucleotidyltransferase family protein [Gemmatimonadaceae bacterium]
MKAVILARGLGTRMMRPDAGATLTAEQLEAADEGAKAMMPLDRGRPFLHFILSALADAGVHEVCMVVAPDATNFQRHFLRELTLQRLRIQFAIQNEARGTADAVLAAERFAGSGRFLVLNADNYYPVESYRALAEYDGCALPGFDREALVRQGNIDAERIRRYALLRVSKDGFLEEIVEKPDEATFAAMGEHALVSMNLWGFTPKILDACRLVKPSARGELELPDAVRILMTDLGERVRVFPFAAPVLDLGTRADVASVEAALRNVRPIL